MAMARTGSELAAPEAATQAKSAPAVIASRRHDLDWHRIAAVPMLIPTTPPEPLTSGSRSKSRICRRIALTAIKAIFDPWGMPLLFAIAGSATWFALQRRSGLQYPTEHSRRLVVLLLFGMLVA